MSSRKQTKVPESPCRFRILRAAAAIVALASSCSVVLDLENQCETDADCKSRGQAFSNTTCDLAQRVCVGPPGGSGGGSSSSSTTGGGGSVATGCQTNQQCIDEADGAASICRKESGDCVQLQSADCVLAPGGNYADDNAVVIGFMSPFTGESKVAGQVNVKGVQLAIEEIASQIGIPGGPGGKPRPLVYVACDDEVDVLRAGSHLMDTVGVPAIIGPSSSTKVTALVKEAVDNGVLLVAPFSTVASLTHEPDKGLLWRLQPSDAVQARAMALSARDLEQKVRASAAHNLGPDDPVRIALVNQNTTYGKSFANELAKHLVFNGKDVSANAAAKNFFNESYDPSGDQTSLVVKLDEFRPHILIALGEHEAFAKILAPVETGWQHAQPKPEYLFPTDLQVPHVLQGVVVQPEARPRIRGTRPVSFKDTNNYKGFVFRHKNRFGQNITPGVFTEYPYDAVYLIAYGILGTRGAPVLDGASIAAGLTRLGEGEVVNVGPDELTKGYGQIINLNQINLEGASGPLTFDNLTGEVQSNFEVWCVAVSEAGIPSFAPSGQVYDIATDTLVGEFKNCP